MFVNPRPLANVFVIVLLLVAACQPGQTPEDTLTAYYEAFKARDLNKLVAMTSEYSLTLLNGTREDLRAALVKVDMAGLRLLEYRILERKTLSPTTVMIRVVTRVEGT